MRSVTWPCNAHHSDMILEWRMQKDDLETVSTLKCITCKARMKNPNYILLQGYSAEYKTASFSP